MKKSTNESPTPAATAVEKPYQVPLIWEIFRMEGGLSLLIVYPLVVLFFLKMALSSLT